MKRNLINFCATVSLFLSCATSVPNKNFETMPSGLEYLFVEKSENITECKPGDVWNLDSIIIQRIRFCFRQKTLLLILL